MSCSAGTVEPVVKSCIQVQSPEVHNAFSPACPARFELTADAAGGALMECVLFDLIAGTSQVHTVEPEDGRTGRYVFEPKTANGVYRCIFSLPGFEPEERYFAYAPAVASEELPEDWPLAIHITNQDPDPLPGFKWCRYFALWSDVNPESGVFCWEELDRAYQAARAAGMKMQVASDGAPVWTSSRGKVQMEWKDNATAYPPDNMDHLRKYLAAMRERYDDGSGTMAAWEIWNEANTFQRYQGSYAQLVEMAQIYREEADKASSPIDVLGVAVSAGHHETYVEDIVSAGILEYLDAVSGHFYEEMHSYEVESPVNNLPKHARMLTGPVHRLGYSMPVHNTECGINCVSREDGCILAQDEVNSSYEQEGIPDTRFPWITKSGWRHVSEFRGAAEFTAGIVMLMAEGVSRTYGYLHERWLINNAPSLYWVAVSVLGRNIRNVDYTTISAVSAEIVDDKAGLEVVAYRLGRDNGPGVTVVWTYRSDQQKGRSKLWQPWLEPVQVRVAVDSDIVTVSDLYGRCRKELTVSDRTVEIPVGEEPCYITSV